MTDHRETRENDQWADAWIDQQRARMNAFRDALDVEAGLREILLQSRPAAMVDDLDAVLDIEAGLREVLPTNPPAHSAQPHPSTAEAGSPSAEQLFQSVSPQSRIRLRAHPAVRRPHRILVLALTIDRALDHDVTLARDLVRTRDLALTSDLASDFDRARALVHDLVSAVDGTRALVHDLVDALQYDLTRARTRVSGRYLRARIAALKSDSTLAMALVNNLDSASALARGLANDLGLDRSRTSDPAVGLASKLSRFRASARAFVNRRAEEVRQAISNVLGQELSWLGGDLVDSFLSDFTTSDLRNADLSGTHLDGVRWSVSGTRWPSSVDIEDLKTHSEETPAGSGIWTVRSGTATVGDSAAYLR
ncbi:hypothetical protein [Streptomyces sp. NPDC001621]|uniref:hypothetical protein n=1 Tax=Streptomyces sp. NPDC001621 TaxID=3364594 RepID=UPI00368915EA